MAEDRDDRRRSGTLPGLTGPGRPPDELPIPQARVSGRPFTLDDFGAAGPFGSLEFSPSGDPAGRAGLADRSHRTGGRDDDEFCLDSPYQGDPYQDERPEPAWLSDPVPHLPAESGWREPQGDRGQAASGGRGTFPRVTEAGRLPRTWQRRRHDLISRVRAPAAGGQHSIVVMSLKGGVGKTTVTVGLGSTLASLRGERVIAVDANPDRGTLSDKVVLETAATIRDLLCERDQILSYADMRAFTSRSSSGLEILASDQDPAVSVAFGAPDYAMACQILADFYSIRLTDCGTGLLHSAMTQVLRHADQIVLASTPAVDSARSADATLDWLIAHGHRDLARNAVLVLSAVRPRSRSTVSIDLLDEHFSARCRAVTRLPFDARLDEGAEVELRQLSRKTAGAFLELAALVADGFDAAPVAGERAPRRSNAAWPDRGRARR